MSKESLDRIAAGGRLARAYATTLDALLAQRLPQGHWEGELSTSALSTATAVGALAMLQRATGRDEHTQLIADGVRWLAENQNDDGGWGDTVVSFSNISTTMLCRAAFYLAGAQQQYRGTLDRAEAHLGERFGRTPAELAEAVRARYGKDRTFSVPILMMSALAGLVEWKEVPPLPFELACLPQSWFAALRLPVVSYALPALIAIGQAVHRHRRSWNPVSWAVRRLARARSLRVLEGIQPTNGGFLEATPLTSFVTMALVSVGQANHPVVQKGVGFLAESARPDGSWPIDTNLSTWVTTLAVNALAQAGELPRLGRLPQVASWLVEQQYRVKHPYTGAAPGGWGWTPLPGAVPDADDSPGALIALSNLCKEGGAGQVPDAAVDLGLTWLLDLQNGDGGWPTFCRGWTKLPFDRSGSDLTAHALRALARWNDRPALQGRIERATARGLRYLARQQRGDGAWLPLWFGNQHAPDDENPTYGTARVLAAYRDLGLMEEEPAQRGVAWLCANQNDDGGWGAGRGTPSSVEETALAVEVLLDAGPRGASAVGGGLEWLVGRVEAGELHRPTPIGFYFAKLWYFERLYPIIFTIGALGRAIRDSGGADPA